MKTFFYAAAVGLVSLVSAFDATIPVLHLPDYYNEETRADFLKQMEDAAINVGFFALTETGLDMDVLDAGYAEMAKFFSQSKKEKCKVLTQDGQRGYVLTESAKDEDRMDYKEFYHIGREISQEDADRLGAWPNTWPEKPEGYKPAMNALYNTIDKFKGIVGEAFGRILMDDPNYINEMIREGDCLMRAIHYPANPPASEIWAGAHTDINFFTILPRSTARGLQVFNTEGEWIDVVVPDNAVIINCGDMIENITNGHFKSSLHRVVDPGLGQERYSLVVFVHPRAADRLDPLPHYIAQTGGVRKYANVTRLELLFERLIDLRLASKDLMEFFVNSGAIERLREVGRFSPKAEDELRKAGYEI
jgi:isopenicillin N synthase-like dioxygenase